MDSSPLTVICGLIFWGWVLVRYMTRGSRKQKKEQLALQNAAASAAAAAVKQQQVVVVQVENPSQSNSGGGNVIHNVTYNIHDSAIAGDIIGSQTEKDD